MRCFILSVLKSILILSVVVQSARLAHAQSLPVITSFNPVSGPPGTLVTVIGLNLTNVTSVRFGTAEAAFKFFGDEIVTTVPTNAATGPITIVSPSGTVTSGSSFAVTSGGSALPVISSFDPVIGRAGDKVTITGTNLDTATSVEFNGMTATFSGFGGQIIATIPVGSTTGPIKVTTPQGASSSSIPFTIISDTAPVILSFQPSSGPIGAQVEIIGSNMLQVTSIQFNGVNASFLVANDHIVATVPAGASTGPITALSSAGQGQSSTAFTISATTASIKSFSPTSGPPGTPVTIIADGFKSVLGVQFNGVDAPFSFFTGQILANVPTNASTGPITLITSEGKIVSTNNFVFDIHPEIAAFSPAQGAVGSQVILSGKNLESVTAVKFNDVTAQFNLNGSNLVVIVPPLATKGPITVSNSSGSASTSTDFIVGSGADLSLRLTSPAISAQVGGSVSLIIAVSNDGPLNASNAIVRVTVPSSIATPSITLQQGFSARVGDDVICSLGEFPAPWRGAIFITLQPSVAGDFVVHGSISSSVPEIDSSNNAFDVNVHVDPGTVVTPPLLSVSQTSDGLVQIRWPAAGLWVLQQSDSLGGATPWITVTNAVTTSATGTNSVGLKASAPKNFFRLAPR